MDQEGKRIDPSADQTAWQDPHIVSPKSILFHKWFVYDLNFVLLLSFSLPCELTLRNSDHLLKLWWGAIQGAGLRFDDVQSVSSDDDQDNEVKDLH